ncbi:MAG: glycosyltransferase [Candidatus Nealsonbacteria bacterium]|nr:glycosyltransferase [Candidatus Nealsonbacteria bacterium]
MPTTRQTSPLPRVLQMLIGRNGGGAESFFVKLALALQQAGLPQRLIVSSSNDRADLLRAGGCDTVQLKFGGLTDPIARFRLRRQLADFRPDVVLLWLNRAARRCPQGDFVTAARLGGYYKLKHYRKCDHLIGNTPDIVRYLVESDWPAERTCMLSDFGDLERLPPLDRAELDTPPDIPLLLSLGRLHPSKGFDVMLRTLASTPGVYYWLAGVGEMRADLEALARELGVADRVRMPGFRNDPSALYGAADLFVLPSRHEPLGNVILEAWTHGLPVVSTAAEGPSWLIDDEENGLLVPSENPAALAAAINRLLADTALRKRIATGGREKHDRNFSRETIAQQYIEFFRRIAKPIGGEGVRGPSSVLFPEVRSDPTDRVQTTKTA